MTFGRLWALLLLLTAKDPLGAQVRPAVDLGRVEEIIRAEVDSGFTGVVLVAIGDSVLLQRAYGGGGARLAESDAFWIGSITKGFTAATILRLQQRGRLSVREPISRFFPTAPPDKRRITLHQLLTHTAGLHPSYAASGLLSRTAAVDAILAQPLAYPPGTGYRYGDDDYVVLAAVIEVVTRRPWREAVRTEILGPAGLRQTGFWCGPWERIPAPVPAADGRRSDCASGGRADWGHRGASGMSSTARDLLRWSRWLRRFREIEQPEIEVRREEPFDVGYGYGARVYSIGGRVVEAMHSGSADDDHTAAIRRLASGVTIVVLSNAGRHGSSTWSTYLAGLLSPRAR